MKAFLDFEASSLADRSYPVEVAWVFQDGRSESHLIKPAPDWTDWDEASEAIHGLSRDKLATEGEAHGFVAARMVEALRDHELFVSAPSWDGKWLSVLLRAGGYPRHALRLRDTDEALRSTAVEILQGVLPGARLDVEVHSLIARTNSAREDHPAHRALGDALGEYDSWCRLRKGARALAAASAAA